MSLEWREVRKYCREWTSWSIIKVGQDEWLWMNILKYFQQSAGPGRIIKNYCIFCSEYFEFGKDLSEFRLLLVPSCGVLPRYRIKRKMRMWRNLVSSWWMDAGSAALVFLLTPTHVICADAGDHCWAILRKWSLPLAQARLRERSDI